MRSSTKVWVLITVILSLVGVTPVLAGSYYTHYTNASCQVTLTLSTNQIRFGETLGITVVASGYQPGPTGPALTIPVEVLLDGQKISTLSAPWYYSYGGVTPVTFSITNLTEGAHSVTIQHTNAFEYYNETIYTHSVFHDGGWFGSDWWDYYYNVYHYRTVPCSDTEAFTGLSPSLSVNSGTGSGDLTPLNETTRRVSILRVKTNKEDTCRSGKSTTPSRLSGYFGTLRYC